MSKEQGIAPLKEALVLSWKLLTRCAYECDATALPNRGEEQEGES
jgi:hypothetical protein